MDTHRILISGLLWSSLLLAAVIVRGQTPDYSELARDASNNGKHEEAASLYTKAIELRPSYSLYSLRAFEYEELGKLDLALADRNKVIELKPYSLDKALEQRGKLYVHMGKYDLAVDDFTRELSISPRRTRVYNYRAEAYLIMGKPDLAYSDFVSFVNSGNTEDGFLTNAIFVAYLSLRKSGKAAEAKKFIDEVEEIDPAQFGAKVARFFKGDLTAAQLLADPNGDPASGHLYVGEMLLLGGDAAAAAEHFRYVRDKGIKYTFVYDLAVAELNRMPAPSSVARRNAEVLAANGWRLANNGDPQGAMASFARAIEIDPTDANAYIGRAFVYGFLMSKYDLAQADLDQALKLAPDDTMALANRSEVFLHLGETDKALADTNKLVSLRSNLSGSYLFRAQVRVRQLKFDLAIADYNKAISLDPKDPWSYRYRAFAEFANAQNADAIKDAVAALTMGITAHSDGGMGTLVIGYLALQKLGKRSEADALVKNWVTVLKAKEWSTGIINYINGDETAEQLLARADSNAMLTRFHTYIGEVLLAKGQASAAGPYFVWTYNNGDKDTNEYSLAMREIVRLALPNSK